MSITAFLNKYCKPVMKKYYSIKYRKEIYKCLKLYMDYGKISFSQSVCIMAYDYDGDLEKAAKIWGICVYCGFIENCK